MIGRTAWTRVLVGVGLAAAACGTVDDRPVAGQDLDVTVTVDVEAPGLPISPLIRGINGDLSVDEMRDAGITLVSWGGNPNSRYNYLIGHAWNTAADWEFRNVNYDQPTGDAFREYAEQNAAAGAVTRLAVPALGWIAKDDDPSNCSFPTDDGNCQWANWDCANPGPIADPNDTSIVSTPDMVAEWVESMLVDGVPIEFLAIDNEPDLWGYTHYDVHPECTTFREVLDTHIAYAQSLRTVAPDTEIGGPVICCWYDYWNPSVEAPDGSGTDFLRWFLAGVRESDDAFGGRTLDVLDVHYYPQSDVFNDQTDEETSARRLRSTRSLWDPTYRDESWIDTEIQFIPRLEEIVEETYPDTRIGITEWNFGADATMNGALAIADVLGIYGREGVYTAAYWRSPAAGTPGYFAFRMHGNYDGQGSAFEGLTLPTTSSSVDSLGAFAAVDGDVLRVMLINKLPSTPLEVALDLGEASASAGRRFTYQPDGLTTIVETDYTGGPSIVLAPYSITILELDR